MKCPHCLVEIFSNPSHSFIRKDREGEWYISYEICPSCDRLIVWLGSAESDHRQPLNHYVFVRWISDPQLIRPKGSARPPCPQEIPDSIAIDYNESCLVLTDSPKASAALSRRCLQHLLRDHAHVHPSDLSNEIQQVIDDGNLPSHISEAIDAVRNIGNFAAHPNKSKSTGEIIEVEPHEAEWNLNVLESLFDFYFVQPAKLQARKDELNKKLLDSGKKPMK